LDALQAAIVSVKLKYLDGWTKKRQINSKIYKQLFEKAGLERQIQLPVEKENRHIYNQFVIRVKEKRDLFRRFLLSEEIGSEVYYPLPLHLQECFSYLNYPSGAFPVTEYAASHSLALPIYPELTENQLAYVVEKIRIFFSNS
jgi:dTDP-4-amino-4,6-dideoxygalactose transaminase